MKFRFDNDAFSFEALPPLCVDLGRRTYPHFGSEAFVVVGLLSAQKQALRRLITPKLSLAYASCPKTATYAAARVNP
jgi:hypothetical protein